MFAFFERHAFFDSFRPSLGNHVTYAWIRELVGSENRFGYRDVVNRHRKFLGAGSFD